MAGPWYVKSGVAAEWAASTAYTTGAPGSRVVAKRSGSGSAYAKGWLWECTTAGTSGSTEPTWPSSGVTAGTTTVTDNTVVWTARDTTNWTYASPYLDYVANNTRIAGGDTVYVSYVHNEAPTTAVSGTFPGVSNLPNVILSVDDATGAPPTALRAGANIQPSGTSLAVTFAGCWYMFGITLQTSSGAGTANISFQQSGAIWQCMENCAMVLTATGSGSTIAIGTTGGNPALIRWVNTTVQASGTTSQTLISPRSCKWEWLDTPSAIQGASVTNTLIGLTGTAIGYFYLRGVDLSFAGTGKTLFSIASAAPHYVVRMERCKYNSAVTIVSNSSSSLGTGTIELVECDSGTAITSYLYHLGGIGTCIQDTTNYKSASVTSDGLNPYSFKLTSGTSTKAFLEPVCTPWMQTFIESTGSHTLTADVLWDSTGFTPDTYDVWLEVEYLNDASSLRSTFYYGRANTGNLTNYLSFLNGGAGSSLPAGGTWTTSGLGGVGTATLSSGALTINEKGLIRARVCLGAASHTIWVDPKITVT